MSKTKFVITFGSLEDFTDEVLHRNIHTVHLFSGIRDESAGKGAPSPWRRYQVVLTVRDGDDILVCQVSVGGQWAIFARDPAGLVHSDNLVIAEKLVRAYLIMRGLEVRPGMYALDYKNLITAGARLWRFDGNKRLVPRWAGFPQWNGDHDVQDVIEVGQVKPSDVTPAVFGKYVDAVRRNIEQHEECRIVYANITATEDGMAFYFEALDGLDLGSDEDTGGWGYPYDPVDSFVLADEDEGKVSGIFGPCPTIQDAVKAAKLIFEAWRLAQDRTQEVA